MLELVWGRWGHAARSEKPVVVFSCLFLILSVFLSFYFLDVTRSPFWGDELKTLKAIDGTFSEMVLNRARAGHLPLYFGIAWVWSHLFGPSELVLRSLNLMFMLPLVAILFTVSGRILGRWGGLAVVSLMLFSPQVFYLSEIARPYVLTGLCVMAMVAVLVPFEPERSKRPVTLAFLVFLGLCSHFSFVPVIVATTCCLLARHARPQWAVFGITAGVAAWLPVYLWIRLQFTAERQLDWLPTELDWRAAGFWGHHLLGPHISYHVRNVLPLGNLVWLVISGCIATISILGARRLRSTGLFLLVLWAAPILTAVAVYVGSGRVIFAIARYQTGLLFLQPILIVAGLFWLGSRSRWLAWIVGTGLYLAVLAGFALNLGKDVWDGHYG